MILWLLASPLKISANELVDNILELQNAGVLLTNAQGKARYFKSDFY